MANRNDNSGTKPTAPGTASSGFLVFAAVVTFGVGSVIAAVMVVRHGAPPSSRAAPSSVEARGASEAVNQASPHREAVEPSAATSLAANAGPAAAPVNGDHQVAAAPTPAVPRKRVGTHFGDGKSGGMWGGKE